MRDNGEIQVWSLNEGVLSGSMNLGVEPTAIACSPLAPAAVIGTASGFVFIVDLSDPKQCRIIQRFRAYNKPLTRIV